MEPRNERFPASHQPPSSTRRVGPGMCTLPTEHGRIRLEAERPTVVAPVAAARASQPHQSKAAGHAGPVPGYVKPTGPRVRITRPSAAQANRSLAAPSPRYANTLMRPSTMAQDRRRQNQSFRAARQRRTGHQPGARTRQSERLLALAAHGGDGQRGLYEGREPVLGANVFRLAQTAPDYLRALLQVRGSSFDCAGLGSTDWMRMACKRPGVRVPLAPLL